MDTEVFFASTCLQFLLIYHCVLIKCFNIKTHTNSTYDGNFVIYFTFEKAPHFMSLLLVTL